MKFGIRKPSFKRSVRARTTGKLKRKIKKSLIPGYGKKGAGWIKNPKKAVYNKVYNKTTFGVGDVVRMASMPTAKSKKKKLKNYLKGSESMETTAKIPFYKKVWFMVLVSVLFPIVGIVLLWKFKKEWNKIVKVILTVIASIWTLFLLIICFAGDSETAEKEPETTVQAIVKEETTTVPSIAETTTYIEEETTEPATETTTEESTTNAPTTKESTTKTPTTKTPTTKAPTTKAPTTKAPTTKAPTTNAQTTKEQTTENPDANITVYRTKSGEKYHYENPCGNGTYSPLTLEEAKRLGLEACEKCVLH